MVKKTSSKVGSKKAPKRASKKGAAPASKAKASKKGAAPASKAKAPKKGTSKAGKSAPGKGSGLRGAAPWVAKHAARRAEELRKRNAAPPPPGSARATLRTPDNAADIKTTLAALYEIISSVNKLKKKVEKNFFDIGLALSEVQLLEMYEAKGYSNFEAFLDREIEIPRPLALQLVRISHLFQRDAAYDYDLEQLTLALKALDGELGERTNPSRGALSSRAMISRPFRFDND